MRSVHYILLQQFVVRATPVVRVRIRRRVRVRVRVRVRAATGTC